MSNGLPDDLICLSEGARLLPGCRPGKRLNSATLWRWATKGGKLGVWRIGGRWYVSRTEVLSLASPLVPAEKPPPAIVRAEMHHKAMADLEAAGLV